MNDEKANQQPILDVTDVAQSVASRIARFFERAILEGEYPPGSRLHEVELAKRLGVSRTPLREAFYMLENKGLLSIIARRGVYVKQVTPLEMDWLLTIRTALDRLAAGLAAENATNDHIQELKGLIDAQEAALKSQDIAQFRDYGQAFHGLIYDAGGNRKLVAIYNTLKMEGTLFPFWDLRQPNELNLSMREHRHLLKAITARNPEQAEAAAEQHISRVRAQIRSVVPKKSQPQRPKTPLTVR